MVNHMHIESKRSRGLKERSRMVAWARYKLHLNRSREERAVFAI